MKMRPFLLCAAALLASTTLIASPAIAADPVGTAMKAALEKHGGSVVTVKFVMKFEGFGQDRELEQEIPGLMIENGLVICSNLRTGGMAAMLGGRGGTMTPRDIKVLVGEDTEGVAAKLIARDSELDLAWVKVNEDKLPKDHPFAFVDFSKSAAVDVGDTLVTVARLGKFFDRASFSHDTRALGMIKKPRKLIYAHTEDYGAPAFAASGDPVGVVIFQTPSREDMEGGEGGDQERGGLVILPGAEVIAATVKAKEAAASGKPVDPPAPALPKTEPDSAKAPQGEPAPAPK